MLSDGNGNGIPDCCDDTTCLAPVQWKVGLGGNGHWYEAVFIGPNLSWNQANELAGVAGGHLATLTSEQEDNWVIDTFLSTDTHWGYNNNYAFGPHIGGWQDTDADDYSEPGGGWRWITTEAFEYTNWEGLDNCCGGQDRMMYYKLDGAIGWDDVAQDGSGVLFKSYIIEWSADCNGDGIVDYGQILDGILEDLDGDGVPDCCQDETCLPLDCNDNGIEDSDDLLIGNSLDCNENGIPDECDLDEGISFDCNNNLIPDECEALKDCNSNGIADECESLKDCNNNGTPDVCETLGDCDNDGTPDVCEILNGAVDANPADGIPDECQGLPVGACCVNGQCSGLTAEQCFVLDGNFAGIGISCADANCPTTCAGDVNGDNQIGIVDLLTIIDGWGFCP